MSHYYESRWVPQREALHELGISRATFWRLRRARIVTSPNHFHRLAFGERAPLAINVPAVRFAMQAHFGG